MCAVVTVIFGVCNSMRLISLCPFLFSYLQHNKRFFLDGLKKLEQRSHKCVELRGQYVEQIHFSIP
jgi:hypothetical protein